MAKGERGFRQGDPATGRKPGRTNAMPTSLKKALLEAGHNVGNRKVILSKFQLPQEPSNKFTKEMIDILMAIEPNGLVSYCEFLAENHPGIYAALLMRILPVQMQQEDSESSISVVFHSTADINAALRAKGLPPMKQVFELPPLLALPLDDDEDDYKDVSN
jgi:hypothetical protein